ncbi:MAG: methylmalonyl-CoA epimerase [Firmicutes bacterium]|nr:methylmalonyl-CoA epimerase [Bacillota bacterium]
MYEVNHIGVVVKNLDKSLDFYTQVLECTMEDSFENDRGKFAFLQAGRQIIELIQYHGDSEPGRGAGHVDHIAFTVADIDAETAKLRRKNVTLLFDEPRITTSGKKILFFTGPDGERLEFVQKL